MADEHRVLCAGHPFSRWRHTRCSSSRGSKAGLFLTLAAANAVGNLLIAAFHSGPSATAWVHAVGAVLAIVGGNAAILAASRITSGWHRKVSVGLGAFGLLSFALFVIDAEGIERSAAWGVGAMQRVFDYLVATAHGGLAS